MLEGRYDKAGGINCLLNFFSEASTPLSSQNAIDIILKQEFSTSRGI